MGTYKYKYNWNFFKKDSEELYYFLGFIAADGYINDYAIEIGLNEKDKYLLEKFRDLIVPDMPLYEKKRTNSFTLKISGKSKMKDFKDFFGMTSNKKGEELKFPEIKEEYLRHFIRGYFDGNGTIGTTKSYRGTNEYIGTRIRILANKNFLTSLNEVTAKYCNHNTKAITKRKNEDIFEITYVFSTADRILHWMYDDSTIYLERKKEKVL